VNLELLNLLHGLLSFCIISSSIIEQKVLLIISKLSTTVNLRVNVRHRMATLDFTQEYEVSILIRVCHQMLLFVCDLWCGCRDLRTTTQWV